MVKTLAKPMLHYRLLNCRASGLLEQWVAHGAAGRAGFEINAVRRGPVNPDVNWNRRITPEHTADND